MKRQSPAARDPFALDISERTLNRHEDLLSEAEHMRMVHQIPVTGRSLRGLLRMILIAFGSGLILVGEWLQEKGNKSPSEQIFSPFHKTANRRGTAGDHW